MFPNKITNQALLGLFCLCLLGYCSSPAPDQTAYLETIEDWQESRNAEMRDTSASWLSLMALHWLQEGESTFGSASTNTLSFPESAPEFAGTFILEDTLLRIKVEDGVYITHEGKPVSEMVLRDDMHESVTYLQMGSINFFAINRPEGIAIRVKDSQSPDLLAFEDIPNFEIDPDWKVEAQLDWFAEPRPIQIPTVLGSERTQSCPARLIFTVKDKQYELSPYASYYGDPTWTLIFSDLTNGESTYGGGRFIELPAPEAGTESIVLDFNKAYNPPCAFSEFATCPPPPPENRLALAIPAGEKMYGEMH